MFKFAALILGLYLLPNVSFAQGKVTLVVEDEVARLENSRIQRRKNADVLVQGYRIFIGMTSSRSDASKIQSEAQEHFGDILLHMWFMTNPTSKFMWVLITIQMRPMTP